MFGLFVSLVGFLEEVKKPSLLWQCEEIIDVWDHMQN